jgi:fatty acyl-CoA reductase
MAKQLKVQDFYKGKTILISGCTGFLGKIILEKIIRTTEPRRVYVMVRKKKGITLEERVKKEIYDSELFKILFEKRPELIKVAK